MNFESLDKSVALYLNGFAHRSYTFDTTIVALSNIKLLKFDFFVAFAVWLWFRKADNAFASRGFVLKTMTAVFLAVAVSRGVQNLMPERLRPLHDPDLHLLWPIGLPDAVLEHWSSFPSDHAAVAFAFVTAIWMTSRPLGVAAALWAVAIECLPRLYLGLHYLSDVTGGALIGIVTTVILLRLGLPARLVRAVAYLENRATAWFYSLGFL